jgi:hypothetical protein
MSYLGPVVALFVIVGIALIYWGNRGPVEPDPGGREADSIGTAGSSSPGGRDPGPDFDATRDELEFRGAGDATGDIARDADPNAVLTSITTAATAGAGRRVQLRNVEIATVENNTLWVREGDRRLAVIAPEGVGDFEPGARIDVTGTTESGGGDGVRIRASEIRER